MLFLVVVQAVAVKQRIGTFTRALTFPTREYDDRNGDFPVGAFPLKTHKKYVSILDWQVFLVAKYLLGSNNCYFILLLKETFLNNTI